MQFDVRTHYLEIIQPGIEDYRQAEKALTKAIVDAAPDAECNRARAEALRKGGAAAIYLHHFADVVANRPEPPLPDFGNDVGSVREWLSGLSQKINEESNVELLGDVADALKHAVLTRRIPREVEEAGQVLAIARGFGEGRYGEGKFGGVEEVWIIARSGPRPLEVVLNSVSDAWLYALNQE